MLGERRRAYELLQKNRRSGLATPRDSLTNEDKGNEAAR